MYYKEKMIDGVLYFKTKPNQTVWRKIDSKTLSYRVINAEEKIAQLKQELENQKNLTH